MLSKKNVEAMVLEEISVAARLPRTHIEKHRQIGCYIDDFSTACLVSRLERSLGLELRCSVVLALFDATVETFVDTFTEAALKQAKNFEELCESSNNLWDGLFF